MPLTDDQIAELLEYKLCIAKASCCILTSLSKSGLQDHEVLKPKLINLYKAMADFDKAAADLIGKE
jgi:hypothetical protein